MDRTPIALRAVAEWFDLPPYRVQVWEVNHGHNGRSHGYRFEHPEYAWAYVPDSIALSEAEREPLRGLATLVLGTAHYREEAPLRSRSLYDMVEALELLEDVQPKHAIFTHLSHTVERGARYELPSHVSIAYDGMSIDLYRSAAASSDGP